MYLLIHVILLELYFVPSFYYINENFLYLFKKSSSLIFSNICWQFNFRGIVSSCFEPHLTVYIELEEKTLMENLEKLVQVISLFCSVSSYPSDG